MHMKLAAAAAMTLTALPLAASAEGDVNIYSYRQAYLLEPLLNAFEQETGIDANVVFAKKAWPSGWSVKGATVLLTW